MANKYLIGCMTNKGIIMAKITEQEIQELKRKANEIVAVKTYQEMMAWLESKRKENGLENL